jgi:hypothetical protein
MWHQRSVYAISVVYMPSAWCICHQLSVYAISVVYMAIIYGHCIRAVRTEERRAPKDVGQQQFVPRKSALLSASGKGEYQLYMEIGWHTSQAKVLGSAQI